MSPTNRRDKLRFSTDGQPEAKASTDPVTIPPRVKHKTMDLARVVVEGQPVEGSAAAVARGTGEAPGAQLRDSQVELPAGLPANKLQEVVFDAGLAAAFEEQMRAGQNPASPYGTPGPRRSRDIPTGPRLGAAANLPELKGEIVDADAADAPAKVAPAGDRSEDHVVGPWAAAPPLGPNPGVLAEGARPAPAAVVAEAKRPAPKRNETPPGPPTVSDLMPDSAPSAEASASAADDDSPWAKPPKATAQPTPVNLPMSYVPPRESQDVQLADAPRRKKPKAKESAPPHQTVEISIPMGDKNARWSSAILLAIGVVAGLAMVAIFYGSDGDKPNAAEVTNNASTGSQALSPADEVRPPAPPVDAPTPPSDAPDSKTPDPSTSSPDAKGPEAAPPPSKPSSPAGPDAKSASNPPSEATPPSSPPPASKPTSTGDRPGGEKPVF